MFCQTEILRKMFANNQVRVGRSPRSDLRSGDRERAECVAAFLPSV